MAHGVPNMEYTPQGPKEAVWHNVLCCESRSQLLQLRLSPVARVCVQVVGCVFGRILKLK